MKSIKTLLASFGALALAVSAANAQVYKLHNVDIDGSAIGQFTTPLTSSYTGVTQYTTDSFGGTFSMREHPVAWAGIELNYSYTDFHERFVTPTSYTSVKTNMHEATAAYIFHPHFRRLQPFLNIGGGAIDFLPTQGPNQWRGAGLVELGFDIPTSNKHYGFRVQGRSLIYRDPNYYTARVGSKTWVATEEPSLGAWYRF